MDWLAKQLFGVKPASWAAGGSWRFEFLAMPKHDFALLVIALAVAGLVCGASGFSIAEEGDRHLAGRCGY